jgi:acyl carrier protein
MEALAFEDQLLAFIARLCRGKATRVERDTPLFESGMIDSRQVVDLMEFVEQALGIVVPDDKLSMEFFRTPADIVRTFSAGPAPEPAAATTAPLQPTPLLSFGRGDGAPSRHGVSAMVSSGDIAAGADGCVSLRGRALALHAHFSRRFAAMARDEGASPRHYPTLLPLADLQRTDYFKSFPQHATFCTCLAHDADTLQHFVADVKAARPVGEAAAGRLEAPAMVLSSALCYQCYREYAGRTLAPGLTVLTTEGRCFRNERGAFRALDRCYEFSMREIVLLGEPDAIDERRTRLLTRTLEVAESLGLAGTVEPATDFFFREDVSGRGRALHQRANALKYELRVRMDDAGGSLAVASFNLHEDYFGRSFGIRTGSGATASTGCVGFGLERWVSAFVAWHGADPERWPQEVRMACREAQ